MGLRLCEDDCKAVPPALMGARIAVSGEVGEYALAEIRVFREASEAASIESGAVFAVFGRFDAKLRLIQTGQVGRAGKAGHQCDFQN